MYVVIALIYTLYEVNIEFRMNHAFYIEGPCNQWRCEYMNLLHYGICTFTQPVANHTFTLIPFAGQPNTSTSTSL